MQTVSKRTQAVVTIKNSRFEGILCPVSSREQVEEAIESIWSEAPKAHHRCYAVRLQPLNPWEFSQDDGEPAGTAGVPILQRLRSADLFDVILFVVRTFGGVKLGRGGLISAYGEAAGKVIGQMDSVPLKRYKTFAIMYDYALESTIQSILHPYPVKIRESEYLEKVRLKILCPASDEKAFFERLQAAEHLLTELEEGPDVIAPEN